MRHIIRALGTVFLVGLGLSALVLCAEPDKTKPGNDPGGMKEFEGLGFSVGPKGGGKARTGMFGLMGEGYKFVYVFDRSGSMGGDGNASLRAVKAELLASLKNLDTVHQFQIIFYNERPVLFNPSGTPGKLAFATDANKLAAERFLNSIEANGGTDHEAALRMAASMRPDVMFFLTDGDDPKLTPQQMDKIREWLVGIRINIIEFGPEAQADNGSFLKELARRVGGQYAYVDTTKISSSKEKAPALNNP
jgi:von Willebrand factor type A domain